MILNIGYEKYILKEDIVAILNKDSVDNNQFKTLLNKAKSNGNLFEKKDEEIKSYIITVKNNETVIYSSIISSKTLLQRNNMEIWG